MSSEFGQQQEQAEAAYRKKIAGLGSEQLLQFFGEIHEFLAQRALLRMSGICDDTTSLEQQYRLSAFAMKQELLKRLHDS